MNLGFQETLKALSDPVRRDILMLLKSNRMTVGEIGEKVNMQNSKLSYHLSQLKKAGLIYEEKEKNFIYYQLNTSVLEEIMLWFKDLKGE